MDINKMNLQLNELRKKIIGSHTFIANDRTLEVINKFNLELQSLNLEERFLVYSSFGAKQEEMLKIMKLDGAKTEKYKETRDI